MPVCSAWTLKIDDKDMQIHRDRPGLTKLLFCISLTIPKLILAVNVKKHLPTGHARTKLHACKKCSAELPVQ